MAAKYCTECGSKTSILNKFCPSCGHGAGQAAKPSSPVSVASNTPAAGKPTIKIRFADDMRKPRNQQAEDDNDDYSDDDSQIPDITSLSVKIEGGSLDEGGHGYSARKFTLKDLT